MAETRVDLSGRGLPVVETQQGEMGRGRGPQPVESPGERQPTFRRDGERRGMNP